MSKYHDIEMKVTFVPTPPLNLHDAKHQQRLKDFAWRITEELGESLEAKRIHPLDRDHYQEEIADALHFLVEFSIMSDFDALKLFYLETRRLREKYKGTLYSFDGKEPLVASLEDFYGTHQYIGGSWNFFYMRVARVIEHLARTCNTLKNKPWKQTQMETDIDYFYSCLLDTWEAFITMCSSSGIDADRLHDLYFRKSEVNKFRQRSNY